MVKFSREQQSYHSDLHRKKMDPTVRKNMKHLIKMFETRHNTGGEQDIAEIEAIVQETQEAYNLALGITILHCKNSLAVY